MAPTNRQQQQLSPSTLDPDQVDADELLAHRYQAGLFDAPYYSAGRLWDDYVPAYRLGQAGQRRHAGRAFADIEPHLAAEWDAVRGQSRLGWVEARGAVEHAWERGAQDVAVPHDGRAGNTGFEDG
ncbi:hypothetical protein [Luteimonas deserti]|uniref:Uncharacterized protein n=1 Tax=Luteimonas deserti TaxID=2752306 RepID=A0A7Z0TY18_9GAMM|nr:hypothetical protein [Luteimonas deserti]NYZ61912.1 hypothetical protein [Luteimonas deserti]